MNWQNVTVELSDLQPWEHNPRTMTKKQAQRLLTSWKRLGQFQTVAIGPQDEETKLNPVYDGHQRLSALLAAYGANYQIDARQSDRPLTEDERRYLITQANLPVGAWNFEVIAGWPEAQEWGFDAEMLQTWNRDGAALATMLEAEQQQGDADAEPQIDRAAELNEKWQVQRGDLWRIGEHRLLCGDSTKREDVERVMQGEKAQMIFTDPPYGVDYDGGAKKREQLEGDHVGTEIYGQAIPLIAEFADDNAPLYLWYADGHAAAAAAAAAGYIISAQIIWAKNNAQFVTSAHYKGKHEPCYYAHKKGKSARWYGPNNEVTLWEYDRANSNDLHPTQKPIELSTRAINNSTKIGEVIIDAFGGSGATLVSCENTRRLGRMIEISPNYCAVILQRMQDAFPGIEIERISEAILTHGT